MKERLEEKLKEGREGKEEKLKEGREGKERGRAYHRQASCQ